ncbi:unnamed protein product [Enterobius vermicularis]|uniref:TRP domain-containing protein n=1 Tax=Enterobius vermicularis TaxID=51028 RepID=A0A0N4V7Z5_ENTVE|nr:unnamed protein product [Enterobius vermicularis]
MSNTSKSKNYIDNADEGGFEECEQDMQIAEVYIDADGRTHYFDPEHYRCCFSALHTKMGTFVLVTLVFHEIIIVFISRLIQLCFSGVMYFALWKQRWEYILPFATSQLTFGAYADISTIIMLVGDLNMSDSWPISPSSVRWLSYVILISLYVIFSAWFTYVLYRCSIFFRDRYKHQKRKLGLLNEENLSDNDDDDIDDGFNLCNVSAVQSC